MECARHLDTMRSEEDGIEYTAVSVVGMQEGFELRTGAYHESEQKWLGAQLDNVAVSHLPGGTSVQQHHVPCEISEKKRNVFSMRDACISWRKPQHTLALSGSQGLYFRSIYEAATLSLRQMFPCVVVSLKTDDRYST